MKKLFLLFTVTSIALIGLTSCSDANDEMDVLEATSKFEYSSKSATAPSDDSIAEIAIGAGFSELVSALSYVDSELDAGLVNLFLNGKDQYTVFAPTNDAFMNLYDALGITSIEQTENPELVLQILLYHVTEGRRTAKSVVPKNNYKVIETLQGGTFEVDSEGKIMATTLTGDMAMITAADISASNGIIHVISEVIIP